MANATAEVAKKVVYRSEEFRKRSSVTLSAELRYYSHAMVGLTSAGYLAKFDDTQAMIFVGVVRGDQGNPLLPAGTADDGTIDLDYQMPLAFQVALTSVAVTDIDKPCYATFDQTATLNPAATTYGNLIGKVVDKVAANIALVEPAYDGVGGNLRLGAVKWFAATGAQTVSKWDIGKTCFCANTAALTLTLPAVASAQIGGYLQFVKTSSDAEIITLDGNSSEEIDGATTLGTIDAIYDCARLVNNGTRWVIVNRDIS